MAAVTRLGLYGGPRTAYAGFTAATTIALTGTATEGITETDIVNGGKTVILTITSDTWVTAGATFNAQRQNIIDGFDDAALAAGLAVTDVVRTSDTVVTITFSAIPGYDITSDSVVEVTVPASALTSSGDAIVAAPTFTISAVSAAAALGGGSGAKKYRRSRYPRRVSIDGRLMWVKSAEEERELLRAWLAREAEEASTLQAQDAPVIKVKKARMVVKRVENRIADTYDREAAWLDKLRREDDEILLALLH